MATKTAKKAAPKARKPAARKAPAPALPHRGEAITYISVANTAPHPGNPRTNLGDLAELAASIKAVGVLQPVVARPKMPVGWELIIGHRRLAAARLAGVKTIPAIIHDLNDRYAIEAMLVENLQRQDLTAFEEANGYKALVDAGMTQATIWKRVGKSQSHVSKRLALLGIPVEARGLIEDGTVPVNDAKALRGLAKLPAAAQKKAVKRIRDRSRSYGSADPGAEIRKTEEELAFEAKMAGCVARAEKDPAPVVTLDPYKSRIGGPRYLGKGHDEVDVPTSKHMKLDCHAIAVYAPSWERSASGIRVRYVCTDPTKHATGEQRKIDAKIAAQRQQKADDTRLLNEKANQRRAFEIEVLTKAGADDAAQLLLAAAVNDFYGDAGGSAAALLGIEPPADTPAGSADTPWALLLEERARKSKAEAWRIGAAVGVELLEECLTGYGKDWAAPALFGWLESKGYETSPQERVEYMGSGK